jgi:hypothetical protein
VILGQGYLCFGLRRRRLVVPGHLA